MSLAGAHDEPNFYSNEFLEENIYIYKNFFPLDLKMLFLNNAWKYNSF